MRGDTAQSKRDGGSFTLEDVEKLIDEVQRATTLEEGSQPGWRQEGSHMKGEFVAQKAEGSVQQDSHKEEESDAKKDKGSKFQEEDSQFESERVQNRIRAHVASLGDECTVGDLGCLVTDVLHILEPISQACRPGSTTRKYDIFHFQFQDMVCQASMITHFSRRW